MQIRIYLDEDFMDTAIVGQLRAAGIDVATAREANMIEQPDDGHLAYATEQGRVLATHNVADFGRLHRDWLRAGRHHSGLVLIAQQRYSLGEQARRFIALAAAMTAESMVDRVEFLSRW